MPSLRGVLDALTVVFCLILATFVFVVAAPAIATFMAAGTKVLHENGGRIAIAIAIGVLCLFILRLLDAILKHPGVNAAAVAAWAARSFFVELFSFILLPMRDRNVADPRPAVSPGAGGRVNWNARVEPPRKRTMYEQILWDIRDDPWNIIGGVALVIILLAVTILLYGIAEEKLFPTQHMKSYNSLYLIIIFASIIGTVWTGKSRNWGTAKELLAASSVAGALFSVWKIVGVGDEMLGRAEDIGYFNKALMFKLTLLAGASVLLAWAFYAVGKSKCEADDVDKSGEPTGWNHLTLLCAVFATSTFCGLASDTIILAYVGSRQPARPAAVATLMDLPGTTLTN